ncbi:hypothetical protein BH23GEM8_BH23GEM8_09190 [soil metagenome]
MANFTLKGMPEALLSSLRQSAAQNHRSLNREMLYRLERSLEGPAVDPAVVLTRIHKLRERTPVPQLTDRLLERATEEGRP